MKQIIVDSLEYMSQNRADIYGFVIMPNHMHILMRLKNDTKATFQRDFLKYTAQRFIQILRNENSVELKSFISKQTDRKYHIWERKSYWTEIYREDVFDTKLAYMHSNPLSGRWNLCENPPAYDWSSCRFYENNDLKFSFLKNFHFL